MLFIENTDYMRIQQYLIIFHNISSVLYEILLCNNYNPIAQFKFDWELIGDMNIMHGKNDYFPEKKN